MPSPGDVVPYPPYPAAGAAAQGGLQYSLEATQLLAKAVLELIVARLPPALAADQSLKVTLQNSIVAAISGNVAVTNMIPAVETGLSKEATLGQIKVLTELLGREATQLLVKAKTDNLDISLSALRDALTGGKTQADIWNSLQTQREISTSLWTDNSGAKYVRRDIVDESAGSITVTWTDESGNVAVPGAGLRPLASTDKEVVESLFTAIAAGVGYGIGDILARVLVVDTSVSPPAISATWMNVTTGAVIAAPTAGHVDQFVGLTDQELRATPVAVLGPLTEEQLTAAGLATQATLAAVNAKLALSGAGNLKTAVLELVGAAAEDGAHASGDVGHFMLGVRNDDMVPRTGGDGRYSPVSVNEKGLLLIQDKLAQWFDRGKLRVVGGSVQLSIAGTASFRIFNPAASGKNLLLVAAFVSATTAGNASFNKNGTLPGPAALTPWNPNLSGADTTVAVVQTDDAAVSGGSPLAASIRVQADAMQPIAIPVLLPENTAINFSVALATGGTVYCDAVYVEGP